MDSESDVAVAGGGNLPAPRVETSPDRLPASYDEAVKAITLCESTVRCRQWADEAATMVHYAKIRDDRTLHNHALQIQLWAERRWGELDKKLHPDRRRENLVQNQAAHRNEGGHISVNGRRPMPDDGTSEYQRRVARRLADIPAEEFKRQVESDSPPSKTQLAEHGAVKRTIIRDTSSFDAVSQPFSGAQQHQALKAFAEFCESTDPISLASGVTAEDRETVRAFVTIAERWLEQFVDNLSSDGW